MKRIDMHIHINGGEPEPGRLISKMEESGVWGGALIYLYSLADAVVDALLSDFDNPIHMALLPNFAGGAQALFSFDF